MWREGPRPYLGMVHLPFGLGEAFGPQKQGHFAGLAVGRHWVLLLSQEQSLGDKQDGQRCDETQAGKVLPNILRDK